MPANPPTKQAARLPKARVMYCDPADLSGEYEFTVSKSADPSDDRLWTHPVAVIPVTGSTNRKRLQSARALIRVAGFFAMGEGERVEMVARTLYDWLRHPKKPQYKYLPFDKIDQWEKDSHRERARAVLTIIASGGARK